MSRIDKLTDAFGVSVKLGFGILSSIAVLSGYLLQRAATVDAFRVYYFRADDLMKPQASIESLAFSYFALTILWPLVLGILCFAFQNIVANLQETLSQLAKTPDSDYLEIILAKDSFRLFKREQVLVGERAAWAALGWLPIVALIGFVGTWIFLYVAVALALQPALWVLVMATLQMTCSLLAAKWIFGFPRTLRSARTILQEYEPK